MKIKEKIIKWLGGYTQKEILDAHKITYTKIEKDLIPIGIARLISSKDLVPETKQWLVGELSRFILNHNLCLFNVINNQDGTYTVEARLWVREP